MSVVVGAIHHQLQQYLYQCIVCDYDQCLDVLTIVGQIDFDLETQFCKRSFIPFMH